MNRFRRSRAAKGKDKALTPDLATAGGGGGRGQGQEDYLGKGGMSRSNTLPELGDFRTSLILPQMMKRFSLLRSADGQLVDMGTLENHLAQQTANGRLTTYEVDVILSQYRQQSAVESSSASAPPVPKRKRIDWSKINQPGIQEELIGGGGTESLRSSIATTSFSSKRGEDDSTNTFSIDSFASTSFLGSPQDTGTLPFSSSSCASSPTATFSSSSSSFSPAIPAGSPSLSTPNTVPSASSAAPTSAYSYQYTRGPNSMFGGGGAQSMSRAGSSQSVKTLSAGGSVKSGGSRKAGTPRGEVEEKATTGDDGAVRGEKEEANGAFDDALEGSPVLSSPSLSVTASATAPPSLSPSHVHSQLQSPPLSRTPSDSSSASSAAIAIDSTDLTPSSSAPPTASTLDHQPRHLPLPQLSNKQINRISRALDNIKFELSREYGAVTGGGRGVGVEDEEGEEDEEEVEEEEEDEEELRLEEEDRRFVYDDDHDGQAAVEMGVEREREREKLEVENDGEEARAMEVEVEEIEGGEEHDPRSSSPPQAEADEEECSAPSPRVTAPPHLSLALGSPIRVGDESTSSLSPISPINEADLRGLHTFASASASASAAVPLDNDAADDGEEEESNTTAFLASPSSPDRNDTEPVDPFYARMQMLEASKVPLPLSPSPHEPQYSPSFSSSVGSSPEFASTYHSPDPDHFRTGPSSPPPPPSLAPPFVAQTSSPPTSSKLPSSPSAHSLASITIPPPPSHLRHLSLDTSPPPSPSQTLSPTSPGTPLSPSASTNISLSATPTPAAASFPAVPSREYSRETLRLGELLRGEGEDGDEEGEEMEALESPPLGVKGGEEEEQQQKEEQVREGRRVEGEGEAEGEGEGEVTMTDEGPFDLSLGGIRLPVGLPVEDDEEEQEEEQEVQEGENLELEHEQLEGAEEEDEAVAFPSEEHKDLHLSDQFEDDLEEETSPRDRTESAASMLSTGSSFHGPAAYVESDEEEIISSQVPSSSSSTTDVASRPQSLPSPTSPSYSSHSDFSPSHLRPTSVPLDRRPSDELLQVFADASRSPNALSSPSTADPDTSDLVLSDLLAIQDSLVRAAARRAARLASNDSSEGGQTLATPSSIASSSMEPFNLAGFARTPLTDQQQRTPAQESVGSRLASRKNSVESGMVGPASPTGTSNSAATAAAPALSDLSTQLAGLGLTSIAAFDLSPPAPSSSQRNSRRTSGSGRRNSRRTSEVRKKGVEGAAASAAGAGAGLGAMRWNVDDDVRSSVGPASSRMTAQTSQTSSISPTTNAGGRTPSTNQSDAFEFSSLVASPETQSWEDAREELREESLASSSPYINNQGSSEDSPPQPHQAEERDDLDDDEGDETSEAATAGVSPSLGAPAQIDTDSFLRVPRNKPRRDPSTTTSMLVRDVRNQATLATFALKKQDNSPTSPVIRPVKKNKSIRKGSISSPQLVSGPIAIPAVPIVKSEFTAVSVAPSSPKIGRSKTRKDKDEGGETKKGLGLRFKMLLKKPTSKDQLGHLNGDEITPFVGDAGARTSEEVNPSGAPITPPNQSAEQFGSSSSPSDFPQTPHDTPGPSRSSAERARSPTYLPPSSQGLPPVAEAVERSSPAASSGSASPALASPSTTSGSVNGRSLSRIMSRIRSNGNGSRRGSASDSGSVQENLRQSAASPDRTTSPYHPQSPHAHARAYSPPTIGGGGEGARRPSLDQEVIGLGFGGSEEHGSRSPAAYRVGSPRVRRPQETGSYDGSTAPLSVGRTSESSTPSSFTFPPNSSRSTTGSGHAPRASMDSMRKLWQAAEDLGLPPHKVAELVDAAGYSNSPTTSSSHAHTGSTSSTIGRGSGHRRGPSETSSASRRRNGSVSSRKSVHDRPPTPPPGGRHHRQASLTSSREAGPIPQISAAYSPPPPLNHADSRLSVYSSEPVWPPAGVGLAPPHSPSLGSLNSRKSSEYANSFLDFYTGGDEDGNEHGEGAEDYGEEEEEDGYSNYSPPPPAMHGRRPSLAPSIDEQLASQQQQQQQQRTPLQQQHQQQQYQQRYYDDGQTHTVRLNPIGEFEYDNGEPADLNYRSTLQATLSTPDPDRADEVVWQVLDDLRNNRLSTLSKDSSLGFASSRHSSMEVEREKRAKRASTGTNASGEEQSGSIANLLRHRDRPGQEHDSHPHPPQQPPYPYRQPPPPSASTSSSSTIQAPLSPSRRRVPPPLFYDPTHPAPSSSSSTARPPPHPSLPPLGPRYPSIYAKDESRLLLLAEQEGGIAPDGVDEGRFYVRPLALGGGAGGGGRGGGVEVPRVPEEHRGMRVKRR